MADNNTAKDLLNEMQREDGHAYAYGGGTLIAIVLLVLLLIWLL